MSDSNRVAIRYSLESTWAETPSSPVMTAVRHSGEDLGVQHLEIPSLEIQKDYQLAELPNVGRVSSGKFSCPLTALNYDDFFQCFMSSPWSVVALAGLTLTVDSTTKEIIRDSGNWAGDGLTVGQWVRFGGLDNDSNNQPFRISALADDTLTVEDQAGKLVTEGPTLDATASARTLRNGLTRYSMLIEKGFLDIGMFWTYLGSRVNDLSLQFEAGANLQASFTFMGRTGAPSPTSVAASVTTPQRTHPFACSSNMLGRLRQGTRLVPLPTALTITASNGNREQKIIGSKLSVGIAYSQFELIGRLDVVLGDPAYQDLVLSDTPFALEVPAMDDQGNALIFTIPAVRTLEVNPYARAVDEKVMLPISFRAIKDPATGCTLQIDAP
jgi:hypothetical protein